MSVPLHLAPGSGLPGWIEELERACFDSVWGELEDCDHLWALPPSAFARWRVIPVIQEAELIRIAVDPSRRRAGLGRALLRHSEAMLLRLGIQTLFLEVRVSNLAAQTLYEAEGWHRTGLRPAYYRDGEDAALYRRDL